MEIADKPDNAEKTAATERPAGRAGSNVVTARNRETTEAPTGPQVAGSWQSPPLEPIIVELLRGEFAECVHRGSAAVVDSRGRLIRGWGDIHRPVFPHSALKLIQALPLIETGATDRFGVTDEEIVLACSSHLGSPVPVGKIASWLERLGLSDHFLECGAAWPNSAAVAEALRKSGQPHSTLHNNNSGKHAGFLTTALHLKEPLGGYIFEDHPVQQRVRAALESMTDLRVATTPAGTEKCGTPAYSFPSFNLALAMARFAEPSREVASRRYAMARIVDAVCLHPTLLVGPGRLSSVVTEKTNGDVIVKGGDQGVYAASLRRLGWGLSLKIDDGAQRAADTALLAVLSAVGALTDDVAQDFGERFQRPLLGFRGEAVGTLRCNIA